MVERMSQGASVPTELRARVNLTKNEIAHLWNGGVLSLKIEGTGIEADIEVRCPEAQTDRGMRILIRRVPAE